MGLVYEAHDTRLDRAVALKTLKTAFDATAERRLRQEARIAASVNHPGICQLYDIGEDQGHVFLVLKTQNSKLTTP